VFAGKVNSEQPRSFIVAKWYKGQNFSADKNTIGVSYGGLEGPFFSKKLNYLIFGNVEKSKNGVFQVFPSICDRTSPIPDEQFFRTVKEQEEKVVAITGHVTKFISEEKNFGLGKRTYLTESLGVNVLNFVASGTASTWAERSNLTINEGICPAYYQVGHDYLFITTPDRRRISPPSKEKTDVFDDRCNYVFELNEQQELEKLSKNLDRELKRKQELK